MRISALLPSWGGSPCPGRGPVLLPGVGLAAGLGTAVLQGTEPGREGWQPLNEDILNPTVTRTRGLIAARDPSGRARKLNTC